MLEAYENEAPDVVIIEGQGALGHPAYSTSSFILRGSCPTGVVLQHAPGRTHRCDFDGMLMPTPASEIKLIESFSQTSVIGVTLNNEHMTADQMTAAIARYERELNIPVTDPRAASREHLINMVLLQFPALNEKRTAGVE